jgi:hypothetical protein
MRMTSIEILSFINTYIEKRNTLEGIIGTQRSYHSLHSSEFRKDTAKGKLKKSIISCRRDCIPKIHCILHKNLILLQ